MTIQVAPLKGASLPSSCSRSQSQRSEPSCSACTTSSRLCPAMSVTRERCDGGARQPHQPGQDDHRRPDRPDHLQHQDLGSDVRHPDGADDGDLEEREPEAAREEVARQGARRRQPPSVQVGRDAGQQHEHGRAEVGDPAREEECRRGGAEVDRGTDEHARVIERHEDHHRSPQPVDGLVSRRAGVLHGAQLTRAPELLPTVSPTSRARPAGRRGFRA